MLRKLVCSKKNVSETSYRYTLIYILRKRDGITTIIISTKCSGLLFTQLVLQNYLVETVAW